MNVAVFDAAAENGDLAPHQPSPRPDKVRQLDAAMRLAWFLARPIDFVDDAHCRIGPLDASRLRTLAGHPAFRGPVNRALASTAPTSAEGITQETIDRLAAAPELRLAALILTAPLNDTRKVALMLVAAVLSRRIRSLILKPDRSAIQEALGVLGFHIAIHEAPLLYPLLTDLDRTPADYPLFRAGDPLIERQGCAVDLGFQLIGRFFDAVEPGFAAMYAKRLSPTARYADRDRVIGRLDQSHCDQFVRLIRRRQRAWSDIIG